MAQPNPPPRLDNDAVMAFVLGMVGLVACQLVSPVALFIGWSYYRRCKILGEEPHPLGIVGMALGAAGTVIIVLLLVMLAVMCFAYVAFFVLYLAFVFLILGAAMIAGP